MPDNTTHIDICPSQLVPYGCAPHEWDEKNICRRCHKEAPDTATQFAQRLEQLINAHSRENASNTPDFILTQYLLGCLSAWNDAVRMREKWYGREAETVGLVIESPNGTTQK